MTTGMRAGANASQNRLSMILESAWATTPATPAFTNLRITSEDISAAKETVRSEEIRPDRNVTDEIMVGRNVTGGLDFELSYGNFDAIIQSLMFSSWSSDIIKNGAAVGDSMTLERRVALPSGSYDYHRFVGCVVNTLSLEMTAGQIITGRAEVMGKFGGRATSIITGATYTDSSTEPVMNAANQFGSLAITGVTGTPKLRSLSISMTNNLREQDALGSLDAIGLAPGRFEATGSMEVYFENGNMYDAFLNHDDLALAFTLGSVTTKKYTITVPTLKLAGDPGIGTPGNDEDVMANFDFTAIFDRLTTENASVVIERAVA